MMYNYTVIFGVQRNDLFIVINSVDNPTIETKKIISILHIKTMKLFKVGEVYFKNKFIFNNVGINNLIDKQAKHDKMVVRFDGDLFLAYK